MKNFLLLFFAIPSFIFANLGIHKTKNGYLEKLSFGNFGSVVYVYEKNNLKEVQRFNKDGLLLYDHFYIYDENGNLLTSDHQLPLRYDDEGNLISNGTYTFSYHSNHLLYKVEGPNTLVYYFYDESGARSSRFDLI